MGRADIGSGESLRGTLSPSTSLLSRTTGLEDRCRRTTNWSLGRPESHGWPIGQCAASASTPTTASSLPSNWPLSNALNPCNARISSNDGASPATEFARRPPGRPRPRWPRADWPLSCWLQPSWWTAEPATPPLVRPQDNSDRDHPPGLVSASFSSPTTPSVSGSLLSPVGSLAMEASRVALSARRRLPGRDR
jgi:hypothetical protein